MVDVTEVVTDVVAVVDASILPVLVVPAWEVVVVRQAVLTSSAFESVLHMHPTGAAQLSLHSWPT